MERLRIRRWIRWVEGRAQRQHEIPPSTNLVFALAVIDPPIHGGLIVFGRLCMVAIVEEPTPLFEQGGLLDHVGTHLVTVSDLVQKLVPEPSLIMVVLEH